MSNPTFLSSLSTCIVGACFPLITIKKNYICKKTFVFCLKSKQMLHFCKLVKACYPVFNKLQMPVLAPTNSQTLDLVFSPHSVQDLLQCLDASSSPCSFSASLSAPGVHWQVLRSSAGYKWTVVGKETLKSNIWAKGQGVLSMHSIHTSLAYTGNGLVNSTKGCNMQACILTHI